MGKTGSDGLVECIKARLVAKGFTQEYEKDYDETFCLVVRQEYLSTLIALSVKCGMKLHLVDVTTAFLNGTLEEEEFMKQPEGFVIEGKEGILCKLNKSIHGLKQSPRCWNSTIDSYLQESGFSQSKADPCIYFKDAGGEAPIYLGVNVGDIIIVAKSDLQLLQLKDNLSQKFELKNLGNVSCFLVMSVTQDSVSVNILINQPAYIKLMLELFGMQDCKPVATPISTNSK